jgi:serine phosphatase RsbU (regulator of sigma subunit)
VLGALSLLHAQNDRRYDAEDLALLQELADRAALALDNARLYAEREQEARSLQESLLPPRLPDVPGLELAVRYRPAGAANQVGGDFYDVIKTETGWLLVVGDVSGKGPTAAAVTALARYTLRALAGRESCPAKLVAELNTVMLRQELHGRFCTLIAVHLQPQDGRVTGHVVCAGHPAAIVVPAEGAAREVGTCGTLIGVVAAPVLQATPVELAPGDTMLLFTDGLLEAGAPSRLLGLSDVDEVAQRHRGRPIETLSQALVDLADETAGGSARDDLAILAARVPGG